MTSSKLRWALIASLVLNLFLAGLIGGAVARWMANQRPGAVAQVGQAANPAGPAARGLRFAADDLAPPQRRAYLDALRTARRTLAPQQQEAREARRQLAQLTTAPSFDRAAAAAAMLRVREADMALRQGVEQTLLDFASTLGPEDRQRFADGLMRRSPR